MKTLIHVSTESGDHHYITCNRDVTKDEVNDVLQNSKLFAEEYEYVGFVGIEIFDVKEDLFDLDELEVVDED